jgi:hypothetical protein
MLDHNIYDMEITKKDTSELFDKLLQISDVYKYSVNGNKIIVPNYYLCNLHELFSILLSAKLILKIITECNKYVLKLDELFEFIKTNIFKNTLIDLDRFTTSEILEEYLVSLLDGGFKNKYKNKYIKYKHKYLQLKKNNNN